jgi:hypothetical protein
MSVNFWSNTSSRSGGGAGVIVIDVVLLRDLAAHRAAAVATGVVLRKQSVPAVPS